MKKHKSSDFSNKNEIKDENININLWDFYGLESKPQNYIYPYNNTNTITNNNNKNSNKSKPITKKPNIIQKLSYKRQNSLPNRVSNKELKDKKNEIDLSKIEKKKTNKKLIASIDNYIDYNNIKNKYENISRKNIKKILSLNDPSSRRAISTENIDTKNPTIQNNKTKNKLKTKTNNNIKNSKPSNIENFSNNLYKKKILSNDYELQNKIKKEQELKKQQEELSHCTFKPKLFPTKYNNNSKNKKPGLNKNKNKSAININKNSLYEKQSQWLNKVQSKNKKQEQKKFDNEIKDCTFIPKLTSMPNYNKTQAKQNKNMRELIGEEKFYTKMKKARKIQEEKNKGIDYTEKYNERLKKKEESLKVKGVMIGNEIKEKKNELIKIENNDKENSNLSTNGIVSKNNSDYSLNKNNSDAIVNKVKNNNNINNNKSEEDEYNRKKKLLMNELHNWKNISEDSDESL